MRIEFHVKTLDGRHKCSDLVNDEYFDVEEICEEWRVDPEEYYSTTDWVPHNDLEQYNGDHGLFGQVECFHQSDYKPGWLMDYDEDELLYRITWENEDE